MTIVSLMPEDFSEGGGLWENKNVRFTNCRFESEYDYGGKFKGPAFVSDLVDLDEEGVITQGWSIGKGLTATDGKKATATGDKLMGSTLVKSTNFAMLITSIVDALADAEKSDNVKKMFGEGKASGLDGLEAFMVRKKVEREGLVPKKREDGRVYDQTVLIVDTIGKLPWEKKAPPGASSKGKAGSPVGTKAAPGAAKSVAEAVDGVQDKALMVVGQVVSKAGEEGISRDDLNAAVFKSIKVVAERNKVCELVFAGDTAEWLVANAEAGGWSYDEAGDIVVAG